MDNNKYRGAIFDLDGVLVDTAKYHYLAWKELAGQLGFEFTMEQNEALKGVSRMRSLELMLEAGGMSGRFSEAEKCEMAEQKNRIYVEYVKRLRQEELLPGVGELLEKMKGAGIKTALGSASKNARMILDGLGITQAFDAIVDGTMVTRAKPDPEVFLVGAELLRLPAADCVVFEDSTAGIEAAKAAGMRAVGIGTREKLPQADMVLRNVGEFCRYLV